MDMLLVLQHFKNSTIFSSETPPVGINLIPLNNWNSKGPNSISLDWKDVIAQARINEALDNLKNRGLIQTF